MTNQHCSIWLQAALGKGAKLSRIFDVFSSAEEIYNATEKSLRLSGVFSERQIDRMCRTSGEVAYDIMERCGAERVDVVTPESSSYPSRLLELPDYPAVLYVKGDISCLERKLPFAIVGTRKPSEPNSLSATKALSGALSLSGFAIVSGGALGIDSTAHTAALLAGGETVAVLGCGIGANYLSENKMLRESIARNGALISECPPGEEPRRYSFPMRNRIIAGICVGVAVMEGAVKSGSLITAKHAYEANRDVFALDYKIPTKANMGVYELLCDGSKPINTPMDVISEYLYTYPEKVIIDESIDLFRDIRDTETGFKFGTLELTDTLNIQTQEKIIGKRQLADSISESARRVYTCFGTEPLSINTIAEIAVMPMNSVLGALTELEIFGYIELLPDTKYILK